LKAITVRDWSTMRVFKLFCSAILALIWTTDSPAIITSDAAGSHSVVPGTITLGLNLDGVVSFERDGATIGSGVLISNRHILTAAHVAEFVDPLSYQAQFYLPTGNLGVDLVPLRAKYPDRWSESERRDADIAILELAVDAPAAAPRYTLYGLADEVGKSAVVAGHGAIGSGDIGGRPLVFDQFLHAGMNRIDVRGEDIPDVYEAAPGDMLVFDFDSGQAANNVLGLLGSQSDLGFGADEVGVYIGDSGGPLFIDGSIAGIHRAIFGNLDGDYTSAEDGSWGELGYVTRVSSYQDFITSATDGLAVFVPERGAWNVDGSGNWSTATNWTTSVPNSAGSPAIFGAVITSPRTVTADVPLTVGRIEFDNPHAYTLAGDGPITLDAGSSDARIDVVTGNHVIAAPVMLTDNTVITVTPATGSLSITGALNSSGVNIAKAGQGTLTINNVRALGLSVSEGTVAVAANIGAPDANTSVVGSLTIAGDGAPTAKLDLTNNAAIVNYAGTSPADTIRQQILSGRGGAGLGTTWNGLGITSSAAATVVATDPESRSVGYAENATMPLGPYTTFRGEAVDDTSVIMVYTRTGDANLDGVVNDDDVTIVGATYAPSVSQPSWALGDFDYNGFVDDDDVTLLGVFYDPSAVPIDRLSAEALDSPPAAPRGNPRVAPGANGVAAVPEPTTVSLLGAMLGACAIGMVWRRNKTRCLAEERRR
jgi:hypothetical protein